jgi:hypothetical protein
MVSQDTFSRNAVGYEVDNGLRWGEAAAGILEIVHDVVFGIEICSYSRNTGRSSNDRYCELSATFEGLLRCFVRKELTRHDLAAVYRWTFQVGAKCERIGDQPMSFNSTLEVTQ